MIKLSEHFSLDEFTRTSHLTLGNTPSADIINHLKVVSIGMEKIRHLLGDNPIHINSGYRSPAVNEAVGGAKNSAHLYGYAADFVCPDFGKPIDICKFLVQTDLKYDQLIQEGSWVHISFAPSMRMMNLTLQEDGKYENGV